MSVYDALIGAGVGGVITGAATFLVAKYQLDKTAAAQREGAQQDRELAQQAATADRALARRSFASGAAFDLLDALHAMSDSIEGLRGRRRMGMPEWMVERQDRAKYALAQLRRARRVLCPVINDAPITKRVDDALLTLQEYDAAEVGDGTTDRANAWTEQNVGRSKDDVAAYLDYCMKTIECYLSEQRLPAAAERPFLRRNEMDVWSEGGTTYGT
jgi:gas vesicle protein